MLKLEVPKGRHTQYRSVPLQYSFTFPDILPIPNKCRFREAKARVSEGKTQAVWFCSLPILPSRISFQSLINVVLGKLKLEFPKGRHKQYGSVPFQYFGREGSTFPALSVDRRRLKVLTGSFFLPISCFPHFLYFFHNVSEIIYNTPGQIFYTPLILPQFFS